MSSRAQARALIVSARRVVAFSGAGLSAESGVSTFRDAATGGHWLRHDPTRLASQAGFADDPELVVDWYAERRRAVARATPNAGHHALAARGAVVNVTQNVDDLLQRAGAEAVIQLHGTLARDRCNAGCGCEDVIDLADPPGLRACPACGAAMRPAVVWFGETLPPEAWQRAEAACAACDVMLVVGTTAEVFPAAGLIDVARGAGAKIIVVNTRSSGASAVADVEVIGKAGEMIPDLLDAGPRQA